MAEVPPVASPAADPLATQIVNAQAAVAQAIVTLALDEVTADLSPTAKNLAAVNALKQRVAQDEAILASLYAQQSAANPPTTTTTPPPQTGLGGRGGTLAGAQETIADVGKIPTIAITGIVTGSAGAAAEGAWGTFLDETEGLVEINSSLDAIAASAISDGTGIAIAEVGGGIVAAIADFPVIAAAVAGVVILYIVGKILVLIAQHFPNPSILGWHPLNFILGGFQQAGQIFVSAADDIIEPVVSLILTPIHLFKAIFQRITNGLAYAHNKIATLFNDTIPQAKHDAISTSENYTDESLGQLSAQLHSTIDDLRTTTNQAIKDAQAEAILGAQQALTTMEQQLLTRISGDETILAAITTEIQTTLPDDVQAQINQVIATENQQLTATTTNLQGQINDTSNKITNLQAQISAANTTITQANTELEQLGPETTENAAQIQALQTSITTAEDDINQWTQTLDDLESQITGISTTLGNVQTAQQLQTSQLNGITALGATGLVAVVGVLASTLSTLKTRVDNCMVDACDETNPNYYKTLLQNLLGLITAGAEIAFIAGAVKDPVGTADALAPTLDGIDSVAVSTLNALLDL